MASIETKNMDSPDETRTPDKTSVSGTLHIKADDGAEADLHAGDTYRLEPGHNAWVVGNDPFEALEFESKTADTYAKA